MMRGYPGRPVATSTRTQRCGNAFSLLRLQGPHSCSQTETLHPAPLGRQTPLRALARSASQGAAALVKSGSIKRLGSASVETLITQVRRPASPQRRTNLHAAQAATEAIGIKRVQAPGLQQRTPLSCARLAGRLRPVAGGGGGGAARASRRLPGQEWAPSLACSATRCSFSTLCAKRLSATCVRPAGRLGPFRAVPEEFVKGSGAGSADIEV
jgi:hypothetical protein